MAVRPEGRDDGPEDDPDDAEDGCGTAPGCGRKVNDHGADGVLATNRNAGLRRFAASAADLVVPSMLRWLR